MAAIVSGNSLGLSLTSLAALGQRGMLGSAGQGRSGEQAYVNIANGNLVLQDFDDRLDGQGLDVGAVRTYNSQGLLNDDNADNWSVGAFGQRIQLSGTLATAGSTLIVLVVAVVATVFTAGVATVGLSAGLGSIMTAGAGVMTGGLIGGAAVAGLSTGTLIATAAAAGAVGSAVSQGVGVAIGAQDSFSWKGVALSAVSAGATAGKGFYLPGEARYSPLDKAIQLPTEAFQ